MAGVKLACGSLAVVVAAACAGESEPAGSSTPASSASSPAPTPTSSATTPTVKESGIRQVNPPAEGTVTVRFVTYGDVDPDDEVPFGMVPDVQIAIIREKEPDLSKRGANSIDHLEDWWTAVGGNDLGIERRIPPGVRVQSTGKKLAAAPARFVATGSDGTLVTSIPYTDDGYYEYSFCVISPVVDDLIAGCNYPSISLWRYIVIPTTMTVYVYFTHGHAIVEAEIDGEDRFQRFIDDAEASDEPVDVWITASYHSDIWVEGEGPSPAENVHVIIVGDAYVNAWWEAFSSDGANALDTERLFAARGWGEVLAHDWVHRIITGPDGLAHIELPPGDYLLCKLPAGCLYENIVSGQTHAFGINIDLELIWKISEDGAKRFIESESLER